MDSVKTFGRNVRAARTSKQWTQEDLAGRTGLAPAQISRIERGTREVRLTTLLRLLAALDADPRVLLDGIYSAPSSLESKAPQVSRTS